MQLPNILKRFNMYLQGRGYLGETKEMKLPDLSRSMESYRSGGMPGPVSIDTGQEEIEAEVTMGGLVVDVLRGYAASTIDALQMRWVGSYQAEATGPAMACEVSMRGRFSSIDMGTAKAGDVGDHKLKFKASYYKLTINGEVIIEIDMINGICMVNGVDREAEHRAIIGL